MESDLVPRQERREAAIQAAAAGPHAVRPFGRKHGDLDIDLGNADRPTLVTQVLASCLGGFADRAAAERAVWEWTLAERLQGLLAIANAGEGARPPWQMRCRGCAMAVEIDVAPSVFVAPPRRDDVACRTPDGIAITARLPRVR